MLFKLPVLVGFLELSSPETARLTKFVPRDEFRQGDHPIIEAEWP